MAAPSTATPGEHQQLANNRRFYNALWRDALLVEPELFNTWPLVQSLLRPEQRRLEVAPGLRPRLPLAGTWFVDISAPALAKLRARDADTALAPIHALPFADGSFDLLCALDIVEHVDDDEGAMAELARVAASGATLLVSTPLHPALWTDFDEFVGHRRRYEPAQFLALLARHGFEVVQSAAFGMKPKSSRLVDVGMWFLRHQRERAMWWYNRVLPYSARRQKPLELRQGLLDTEAIGEVLLVCRRH
jgi:SAM-dependent methyltransferase